MADSKYKIADYLGELDLLAKHLPVTLGDDTLLILKGHLLVEQLLSQYIDRTLANACYFKATHPRFFHKLALSRSLNKNAELPWIWPSMDALNSARNALAHSLEHPQAAQRMTAFIQSVPADFLADEELLPDAGALVNSLVRLFFGVAFALSLPTHRLALIDALRLHIQEHISKEVL